MGTGITLPSKDEAQSSNYGLLDEDDYIVRVESFSEVTRDNQWSKRDEDGNALPTLDFILKPMAFADAPDTDLVDQDGEPVDPDKHLIFFYDPHRLGTRPVVSRSRQFLASLLGVAPDGRIELPEGLSALIGKECVATVTIKNGKNNITSTRPLKKRTRVRTAAPEPEVQVADEEDDEF